MGRIGAGIGGKTSVLPGSTGIGTDGATAATGAVQLDSKTSSNGILRDSLLSRAAFNAS